MSKWCNAKFLQLICILDGLGMSFQFWLNCFFNAASVLIINIILHISIVYATSCKNNKPGEVVRNKIDFPWLRGFRHFTLFLGACKFHLCKIIVTQSLFCYNTTCSSQRIKQKASSIYVVHEMQKHGSVWELCRGSLRFQWVRALPLMFVRALWQ